MKNDKPWETVALQDLVEIFLFKERQAVARKTLDLEQMAYPTVPLDFSVETCGKFVVFLAIVEQCGF